MVEAEETIQRVFSESKLVSQLSDPLREYVLARCIEVVPYLEKIPTIFDEYTGHGVRHSCAVLSNADRLLAHNELNKWEILILVLSAFYHDIGMSCPSEEWGRLEEAPDFQREYRILEDFALPRASLVDTNPETVSRHARIEYLRRHHGERCRTWIETNFPPENVASTVGDIYVWSHVSTVSIGHTLNVSDIQGEDYPRSTPVGMQEKVDLRFLTCLLRLADICHLSRDRALPYIRNSMAFTSNYSESTWEAVGEVEGVVFDASQALISVGAKPRDFKRHRMVSEFVGEIRTELQNVHRILAGSGGSYQFSWKYVDDTGVRAHSPATYVFEPEARFHLVEGKIVHLLMGSRLYSDPLYALRECLQNAVDAIRVYKLRDPSPHGRVIAHYCKDPNGVPTLNIFDSGTGMDLKICMKHLLSVGSDPFSASERSYKEWGAPGKGSHYLIAQHGIGFLSCFMIANKVEVFSKYPNAEQIHLVLDSPTRVGEFRTTNLEEFPRWSKAVFPESNPWEESHGTCVRLCLNEAISKFDLMRFLAENVLRVDEKISVIYENEFVALNENWGGSPQWIDAREDVLSLPELYQKLIAKRHQGGDFYDGLPHDPSVHEVVEETGDIRGVIRLHPERGDSSRLSQDGFLIREGADSLFVEKLGDRYDGGFPFYFDIDVRGNNAFELDAERARVTPGQKARIESLLDWIEERGLRSIGAIESALFFTCGNHYYHGGADILLPDDNRVIAFHGSLRSWYGPERLSRIFAAGKFEAFVKAKLFSTIGGGHNEPISIDDMRAGDYSVLVPRLKLFDGEYDPDLPLSERRERQIRQRLVEALLAEVSRSADIEKVIFLPKFPESFTLPLSVVFGFEWTECSRYSLLGRLVEKEPWEAPARDLIEEKFKELGGFMKTSTAIRELSPRRRSRGRSSAKGAS